MPARSIVTKFKDEFVEHIRLGRCPFRDRGAKPAAHGAEPAHAA
jgi:hypothetical protein